MNIPSRVKIGGITYKVEIADDWIGGGGDDGETCWRRPRGNTIYINSALTPEAQSLVFIHEALHAMNSTMNHEFLDSLAQQLYQFLNDNKLLK